MTQKEVRKRSLQLKRKVLQVNEEEFDSLALDIFRFQVEFNPVYNLFLELLDIKVTDITKVYEIPLLPISLFKTQMIRTGRWNPRDFFASSGTSGQAPSRHYVSDPGYYLQIARHCFESHFGALEEYCFLGLLPSYLERGHSSLVAMVNYFIQSSRFEQNGFYLYEHNELNQTLQECRNRHIPTILVGVSYALLDFFEAYTLDFPDLIVMETGGMKGQRRELTRLELHNYLVNRCNGQIGSEYGMTELFSQAYSVSGPIFKAGPFLKPLIFERDDPLVLAKNGESGILGFIDLGNVDTCSFILTEDLGQVHEGGFEVLGRHDHSEWRGCNLMLNSFI